MKHDRIFTIRKFIRANSLKDAIEKEKGHPVDKIYMDEFNMKNYLEKLEKHG